MIQITDINLVSALLTMGISPEVEAPITKVKRFDRDGNPFEHCTFNFQGESMCGQYKTTDLIHAWNNPNFNDEFPEHPFAYIRCAFNNREFALDKVKQAIPLIIIEKNGKHVAISENASKQLKEETFRKI
jgi:hypothetical protein